MKSFENCEKQCAYCWKTAPKALQVHFADTMSELGAKRPRVEPNVYYFPGKDFHVMSYVDSILVVGLRVWFCVKLSQLLLIETFGVSGFPGRPQHRGSCVLRGESGRLRLDNLEESPDVGVAGSFESVLFFFAKQQGQALATKPGFGLAPNRTSPHRARARCVEKGDPTVEVIALLRRLRARAGQTVDPHTFLRPGDLSQHPRCGAWCSRGRAVPPELQTVLAFFATGSPRARIGVTKHRVRRCALQIAFGEQWVGERIAEPGLWLAMHRHLQTRPGTAPPAVPTRRCPRRSFRL